MLSGVLLPVRKRARYVTRNGLMLKLDGSASFSVFLTWLCAIVYFIQTFAASRISSLRCPQSSFVLRSAIDRAFVFMVTIVGFTGEDG